MSDLCSCPLPAEIPTIVDFACPENFDQIQKLVPFRKSAKDGLNWFADEAELLVEANWDTLLAEIGNNKIQLTTFLQEVVIPQSEEQTEGGNDNTTINGVERSLGSGFTKVTGSVVGAPSETIRSLRALSCESQSEIGVTNLESFYLARNNTLIYAVNEGDTAPSGFRIYNFFVGDVGSEGFNQVNKIPVSWSKEPGWSNYFKIVKLPFDLLSKLNP